MPKSSVSSWLRRQDRDGGDRSARRGNSRWRRHRTEQGDKDHPGGAEGMIPAGVKVFVASHPVDLRKDPDGMPARTRSYVAEVSGQGRPTLAPPHNLARQIKTDQRPIVSRTNAASPSARLRKSTGFAATMALTAPVGPIMMLPSAHR